MTRILYAKPLIEKKLAELKSQCLAIREEYKIVPTLNVILVGQHPPSLIYTKNKKRFCESFGAKCEIIQLNEAIDETSFLTEVAKVTEDSSVHGCLIQLPLPKQLQHINVGLLVPPHKDVDGLHPENIAKLFYGWPTNRFLAPCTPKGILTLLKYYQIDVEGKGVCIIGRSAIVGKPLALLLNNANATVTLCHSHTQNLVDYMKNADIIISAVGKAELIGKEAISPSRKQVFIDVGMNKNEKGLICGDIKFEEVKDSTYAISPVPGGVGPMTILSMAENLLWAAKQVALNSRRSI